MTDCPGVVLIYVFPAGPTTELHCQKDGGHPGKCKRRIEGQRTYWWGFDRDG